MMPQFMYDIILVFACGCNAGLAIYIDKLETKIRRIKIAHQLELTHYKQMLRE
jgi:hypothetical protein